MISQTSPFVLTPLSSNGAGGTYQLVMINNSTLTTSRLSDRNSLPLMTRMVVNPVSAVLNGIVVNCFEGTSSTESVAITTIRIIDPGRFGKISYFDLGMMVQLILCSQLAIVTYYRILCKLVASLLLATAHY